MSNESYERAYPAIIILQELTEMEEVRRSQVIYICIYNIEYFKAIEYRLRPERRSRIALLWSRRLQSCRENVDQWNKLLMLRYDYRTIIETCKTFTNASKYYGIKESMLYTVLHSIYIKESRAIFIRNGSITC